MRLLINKSNLDDLASAVSVEYGDLLMGIYLLIFVLLMLFVFFEKKKETIPNTPSFKSIFSCKKDLSELVILLLSITIIVISGIRWQVGSDWESFLHDFEYFKTATWNEIQYSVYGITYGNGYVFITYFFAKYIGNYSIYLTFQAFFIVSCVYPIIYKYSKYPLISFLGLFAFSFGYAFAVPRSGFAIAICFRAFDALLCNKRMRFVLLVGLATLFHNTAIIFLLLFFLDKVKLSNLGVIVIGIISLLISFFTKTILYKIASLSFIPLSYSLRIIQYVSENVDYVSVSGFVRVLTRGFVLVLLFIFLWNKRKDRFNNIIVNMYVFASAIYIAVSNTSEVLMRLSYYFEDISQFFIFAECIDSCKGRNNRLVIKLIIVLFFIGKMLPRLVGQSFIVPYRTILY